MSIIDDLDCDALTLHRIVSPSVVRREYACSCSAFGEGAVYRAVTGLRRTFFEPPTEGRAHWDIERELCPTKLKS
jgi:hypothetical protein